ncbi:MAG: dephospho-CoA kinase [Paludibacteraceae bacterium]|nr:dephospho-CoA kinase [Paludibacteraceae bacterium]
MQKIGITGGIGSGKSYFCRLLEIAGIPSFNADVENKNLLNSDQEMRHELIQLFGEDCYTEKGFNKAKVAKLIFEDASLREKMNAICHPRVARRFEQWCEEQAQSNIQVVLLESAILFESGFDRFMDKVILVTAPVNDRIERTMKRDNCDQQTVQSRMNAQQSDEEKARRADFILYNGPDDDPNKQVFELLAKLFDH